MSHCLMVVLTMMTLISCVFGFRALWPTLQALKARMSSLRLPVLPRLAPAVPLMTLVTVSVLAICSIVFGFHKSVPCNQSTVQLPRPVIAACAETGKFLHR